MTDKKLYRPDDNGDTLFTPNGVELWSYYVYSSYENAKKDFPDRDIIEINEDEIEYPYFIDGGKGGDR
jgi:hypothetical protein